MKILYFYPNKATFVNKDITILSKSYEVVTFEFFAYPKWKTPYIFLKQLIFIILKIRSTDLLICQFAGYHSFLPCVFATLFKRKSIIILGGTDCCSFPSIGYGAYQKRILSNFTRWSIQLATHLSPVHESMQLYDYSYDDNDFPKQGFEYFCGKVKADIKTIYNGYDSEKFKDLKKVRIPNSFITVAMRVSGTNFNLKGIDLIFKIARVLESYKFTVIGNASFSKMDVPPNVELIPQLANEELIEYYNHHEFYLQLSMSEGFPNALCEAMLCGCIPIGSNVSSIPFIIADSGFILSKRNEKLLVELITKIKNEDKSILAQTARQRIVSNFTLEKRTQIFTYWINSILKSVD